MHSWHKGQTDEELFGRLFAACLLDSNAPRLYLPFALPIVYGQAPAGIIFLSSARSGFTSLVLPTHVGVRLLDLKTCDFNQDCIFLTFSMESE